MKPKKTRRKFHEIDLEQARWTLNGKVKVPETTAGMESTDAIIGQDRAIKALRLGLELYRPGYNVFVCGIAGSGRTSTVRRMLDKLKPACALAEDLAYVHNFDEPERPRLIVLPRGQAPKFREAVHEMVKLLRREIESLVNSESTRERVKDLEKRYLERAGVRTRAFQASLASEKLGLARAADDQTAFPELVYIHEDQPIDIARLDVAVQEGLIDAKEAQRLQAAHDRMQPELQEFIAEQQRMQSELIHERTAVEKRAVALAVTSLKNLLLARFSSQAIEAWLGQVEKTILNNLDVFRQPEAKADDDEDNEGGDESGPDFSAFDVNVILTSTGEACPIVVENIPNWQNLFGSQDRVPVAPGVYGTDFSRIKPGSLVRAQGGYLVLNATDLLSEGSLWQAFKRVLRTGELVIQPPESQGAANAPILNPDPIPISVKVILLGSHRLYEVLCENDSDFAKIFKIKADFDTAIDFSKKSLDSYVDVIVRILRTEKLRDLDRSGLDQILQQSMRISGRKERLTTRFSHIADMLREADYHANREESALIRAEHVRTAVHDMHERLNLLEEKIQRRIHDGDVHIETEGETVGQLNGLTV
ncbi:MAG: AAA family ATPase, partial [Planctomycetes bacterium]|nr:AAA family ATPase [Planctomycetota bacterium]